MKPLACSTMRGRRCWSLVGRREAHEIEAHSARRLGQLGILLRRQIDDDDPVDPGGDGVLREALRSVAVDRVVIPHQHDRGRLVGAAQLADERQGAAQGHALFQGTLAGLLDRRAIGHRIGERHADLDQIGARCGEAAEQPGRGVGVGIARGQIGDEAGATLLPQRRKAPLDPAHDRTPMMLSLSAPGGGEGRGEVGVAQLGSAVHLTLPVAAATGPLPFRSEGRRG